MTIEQDLIPSELKAIEDHKYYMSLEQGKQVSIEEAIKDFLERYEGDWCRQKTIKDNLEQKTEIDKHKYNRSRQVGRDLGQEAVDEWREKYAHIWRDEQESLAKNEFLERKVILQNVLGLHVRPSCTLVKIALKYDCDVYVHKDGMENYNFKIKKKPYLNVRSVLSQSDLLELCAAKGDELEFIAYGKQAKEALDEIESIVNNKFGEEK